MNKLLQYVFLIVVIHHEKIIDYQPIWGWNHHLDGGSGDGQVLERTPDGDCQRYAAKQVAAPALEVEGLVGGWFISMGWNQGHKSSKISDSPCNRG